MYNYSTTCIAEKRWGIIIFFFFKRVIKKQKKKVLYQSLLAGWGWRFQGSLHRTMLGSCNCGNYRSSELCYSVNHPLMMSLLLSLHLTQQLIFLGTVNCSCEYLQSGFKPSLFPFCLTTSRGGLWLGCRWGWGAWRIRPCSFYKGKKVFNKTMWHSDDFFNRQEIYTLYQSCQGKTLWHIIHCAVTFLILVLPVFFLYGCFPVIKRLYCILWSIRSDQWLHTVKR